MNRGLHGLYTFATEDKPAKLEVWMRTLLGEEKRPRRPAPQARSPAPSREAPAQMGLFDRPAKPPSRS